MSEQNKAFVRSWLMEVVNKRNFKIFDEYFALSSNEDFKRFLVDVSVSFPDEVITIERQIAEGDWVATWTTARGTHKGEFLGIPPTGKQVEYKGLSFDRLADGKIVEHSSIPDFLGVVQQLGATIQPQPQAEK